MLPLQPSTPTTSLVLEAECRWLAEGEVGQGREATKRAVYEEVFRYLQDRELLLRQGFGVKQALTSNWRGGERNWTLSAGDFCLHQRYSAVTSCLYL